MPGLGVIPSPERRDRGQPGHKATGEGGEEPCYGPGKNVKGRKRHLMVDTEDLVMRAKVYAASVFDRYGTETVLHERAEGPFPPLSPPPCAL